MDDTRLNPQGGSSVEEVIPVIVSTKTYTVVVTIDDTGMKSMNRTNNGFDVIELLGIASLIQKELVDQLHGKYKPDVITRTAIID